MLFDVGLYISRIFGRHFLEAVSSAGRKLRWGSRLAANLSAFAPGFGSTHSWHRVFPLSCFYGFDVTGIRELRNPFRPARDKICARLNKAIARLWVGARFVAWSENGFDVPSPCHDINSLRPSLTSQHER